MMANPTHELLTGRKGRRRASEVLLTPSVPEVAAALDLELLEARERWKAKVFDAAVQFAIEDDDYRRRLAAKVRDLGESRPRRAVSALELQQVATASELLRLHFTRKHDRHRLLTPRMFDEIARFLGITPGKAKDRYYRALALGLIRRSDV